MRLAFVGRRDVLAGVDGVLDDALAGRGALLLVAGEPGIGKTRLAEEVAARAAAAGFRALRTGCWDGPSAPAYWPWVQLLRGHAAGGGLSDRGPRSRRRAAELARLVPDLLEIGSREVEGPAVLPADARFRLFDAVAGTFVEAAVAGPLLLVLDDLHWADPPSLHVLGLLAPDLPSVPLVVLGTYRDVEVDEGTETGRLLAALAARARTLRLEGLDDAETSDLLASVAGAPSRDVVASVQRASGGNPLFVTELGRLVAAHERLGGTDAHVPIPAGARAVIARRLARLADRCRDALATAAVAGAEFDVSVVARAAGVPTADLREAIDEALRVRLVAPRAEAPDRFAFSHALVRDVIYDDLGAARRASLHAATARALEQAWRSGDESVVPAIAQHLLLAGDEGDPAAAVAFSERAGMRAVELLAYEDAAAHFSRAVATLERSGGDTATRARLLVASGRARRDSGDTAGARDDFLDAVRAARRAGERTVLAEAVLGFGAEPQFAGLAGADRALVDLLDEALSDLPTAEEHVRTRLMARLAEELYYLDRQRSLDLARQAAARAEAHGDATSRSLALSMRRLSLFGGDTAAERAAIAGELVALGRECRNLDHELWGRVWRVNDNLELGELASVEADTVELARLAEQRRLPSFRWFVALWRAMRALADGRLAAAERLAAEALELGAAHGQAAVDHYGMQLIAIRREQGRLGELVPLVRDAAEAYPYIPAYRAALALALVESGEESAGRAELDRLATGGFASVPADYNVTIALLLLSECCAALGDAARAEQLYERLSPWEGRYVTVGYGAVWGGAATHQLGLLAATAGRLDVAVAHLENAVEADRAIGSALWVARAQCDLGRLLSRRGDPGDVERAEALLRTALDTAEELGLTQVARRAGDALGTARQGRSAPVAAPRGNVFVRTGDVWRVVFDGAEALVKDAKGMNDLASLLAVPHREVSSLDLATAGAPAGVAAGLAAAGGDEVLDATARAAYRRRLAEVEEELDAAARHADAARAERLAGERAFLARELAAAHGLGRRTRRSGHPAEKARQAVSWRIRKAIDRIDGALPALGAHLKRSVRTGTFCSYDPERPVDWEL